MAPHHQRSPREPVTAAEDRLATIGDLLRECLPPDVAAGQDQCAHGTWPCVITQAAWRAQGRDLGQQAQAARQPAARRAQPGHVGRQAGQEAIGGLDGTTLSAEARGRTMTAATPVGCDRRAAATGPSSDSQATGERHDTMNETTLLCGPDAWPGHLTVRLLRLPRHLSERLHTGGDALAHAHGWTITPTTGRFGFRGRTYRDPRFTARAPTPQPSTPVGHAAPPGRRPTTPAPDTSRPERRNIDA